MSYDTWVDTVFLPEEYDKYIDKYFPPGWEEKYYTHNGIEAKIPVGPASFEKWASKYKQEMKMDKFGGRTKRSRRSRRSKRRKSRRKR